MRGGDCKFFKEIRLVRVAYGFTTMFKEVKNKDVAQLRKDVFGLLGGRSTYYRYHRGEYKLLPEQQEAVKVFLPSMATLRTSASTTTARFLTSRNNGSAC